MSDSLIINLENHRSTQRIKELGEVFTPEQYVKQMLTLFDSSVWSDENTIFFEPTSGHGNIVVPIFQKRLHALEKKYLRLKEDQPTLKAIANSLNTLWAIDICPLNVELTRKRLLYCIINHYALSDDQLNLRKARNFWGHILCSIHWQFCENEALSGLSETSSAKATASKTKLGKNWFAKNGHKRLDFTNDWVTFFENEAKEQRIPSIFLRSLRFFDSSIAKPSPAGFEEFNFAKGLLHYAAKNENVPNQGAA